MKTLKLIQIRKNQTINNSLTLKNQKVMKTKKYSISMKALAAVVFTFAFSAFLNGQEFVTPAPSFNTQATAEEVRAASIVTYDLNNANHTAGDSYRWVVRGGTIAGGTGVAPETPHMSLAPGNLDFGEQTIDTPSDAQTITLANDGTAEITGDTSTVDGSGAHSFSVIDHCAGVKIGVDRHVIAGVRHSGGGRECRGRRRAGRRGGRGTRAAGGRRR